MRFIVRLGWIFGALFVLVVFFGLLLPREYKVERRVETSASIASIHRLVGEPAAWPTWGGPPERVEIVDADPSLGVAYELRDGEGAVLRRGALRYAPVEDGVRIAWVVAGGHGSSPLARYRSLAMEWQEGPRLEEGLARLAGLAEGLDATGPPPEESGAEAAPAQPAAP